MSDTQHDPYFEMSPGEKTTVLFMQMVFQLSSLATLLLGKVPHPETGETRRDLEAAQLVIDQLDMLAAKTKGNLTREEETMLRQTLMDLQLAYVEAVNHPQAEPKEGGEESPTAAPAESSPTAASDAVADDSADSKKRFTKKY